MGKAASAVRTGLRLGSACPLNVSVIRWGIKMRFIRSHALVYSSFVVLSRHSTTVPHSVALGDRVRLSLETSKMTRPLVLVMTTS